MGSSKVAVLRVVPVVYCGIGFTVLESSGCTYRFALRTLVQVEIFIIPLVKSRDSDGLAD